MMMLDTRRTRRSLTYIPPDATPDALSGLVADWYVEEEQVGEALLARYLGADAGPLTATPASKQAATGDGTPPSAAVAAAAPHNTGIMLALFPSPAVAHEMALPQDDVPGALAPQELHVTLCVLGKIDEAGAPAQETLARVAEAVSRREEGPLSGRIGGIGRFTPVRAGEPMPFIALVDVPGLVELRVALVEALAQAGVEVASDHGFTPHMTLAYLDTEGDGGGADAEIPEVELPDVDVSFDEVWLAYGDTRTAFPLGAGDTPHGVRSEEQKRAERQRARAALRAALCAPTRGGRAQAQKYSPDQERDDHGRFGSGGGGSASGEVSPLLESLHSKPGWDEALAAAHDSFASGFDKYPEYAEGYTTATYLAAEQAHIEQMFATTGVWTRTSEQALAQALADGRFKSAFETRSTSSIGNTSLNSYLNDRRDVEQTLFGYPRTLDASQRPLYGYASNDPNGTSGKFSDYLDAYGTVAVHFDDALRSRTTVCSGDSADSSGALSGEPRLVPQPINAPDYRAFSSGNSPLNETLDGGYYHEVQIHGGNVTPSDVAEVVFHGSPPATTTTAALDSAGIPYRTVAPSASKSMVRQKVAAAVSRTPSILFAAHDVPGLYILSASAVGDVTRGQILDSERGRLYPPMSLVALLTHGGLSWGSYTGEQAPLAGWLAQASDVPPPPAPASAPPPPAAGYKYSPDQARDSDERPLRPRPFHPRVPRRLRSAYEQFMEEMT